MDINKNKAIDTTDLDKAQAAATSYVGPAVARRLVGEHRNGRLQLRIPGTTTTTTAEKHHGVYQRSVSSPALFTWLMVAAMWEPWSEQGEREGWGVDIDGKRLMWITWADDNILIARDAAMTRIWGEATRLINAAGFTVDATDKEKRSVWTATGPQWRAGAQRGVDTIKTFCTTFRRGADSATAETRSQATAKARHGYRTLLGGWEQHGSACKHNTPRWDQSCFTE